MTKKIINILVLLVFVINISGCAGTAYMMGVLPASDIASHPQLPVVKENVSVLLEFFEQDVSDTIFDCAMTKKGIEPIFVIIENKGNKIYSFDKNNIIPEYISGKKAAKKCERRVTEILGWRLIPAFIVYPVGFGVCIMMRTRCNRSNRQMEKDYIRNEIRNSVVRPGTSISGVVFFPSEQIEGKVIISLIEKQTGEKLSFEFYDHRK